MASPSTTSDVPSTRVEDPRPRVWVGHIGPHPATDLEATVAFFELLGTRTVASMEHMAVLELRGGTHVIVQAVDEVEPGSTGDFDLMVDDLDATHISYAAAGLAPSAIRAGGIHSSFTVTDPSGIVITINSSHVAGPV